MLGSIPLAFLAATASAASISARADPLRPRWQPGSTPIRGVNLGSQFIVEPWMASDAWRDMGCGSAPDEWTCVQTLGQEKADAAFKKHWESWVTKDDISKIASLKLNTIRIPVGFWIKEDLVDRGSEHYPKGGLPYLDKIVGWASDAGLQVIIDLHGGPGSQSKDQSFTGHSTSNPGFYTSANFERANKFLEWMAERIHKNNAYRNVYALQVMNEPVHADNEFGSQAAAMIKDFYPAAWSRIRNREKSLGVAAKDQLNIMFMGDSWGSGNPASNLPSDHSLMSTDDHKYYKWDPKFGGQSTRQDYISAACSDNDHGSSVVGEWSLQVATDDGDDKNWSPKNNDNNQDLKKFYQQFWGAQAQAYEKAGGWVFWSWKCNWIGGFSEYRWCYEAAVDTGVIPKDATSAKSVSPCK
ncbi:hypothetical protein PG996_006706 [Apiospora saccharicola]|uniref:glucan 1,3-beta-glucosidase n=1 Tax=Apiospora saccharicola TaxID=335842 RepID=A0ABR1VC32_9PEZI